MKKLLSKVLAGFGALVIAFSLAACGVSQKSADKINAANDAKESMTWSEVIDLLGDGYAKDVDFSLGDADKITGAVTWYKGYESAEDAYAAVEAGKTVKKITVTFTLGKAINATYSEMSKEENNK